MSRVEWVDSGVEMGASAGQKTPDFTSTGVGYPAQHQGKHTVNCCLSSSKGVLGQLISGGLKKTEYKIVDQNKL